MLCDLVGIWYKTVKTFTQIGEIKALGDVQVGFCVCQCAHVRPRREKGTWNSPTALKSALFFGVSVKSDPKYPGFTVFTVFTIPPR